jgi:hypothetical protein
MISNFLSVLRTQIKGNIKFNVEKKVKYVEQTQRINF